MASAEASSSSYNGRTAWARNLAAPVRDFLSTETGSAIFLLAATCAALVWSNVPGAHYESVWTTKLSIELGGSGVSTDLRHWVNEGLMTFFFLVVGLEAKREFDVGDMRERRRLAVPVLAALGGMAVPVAIFLAINAGGTGAHGWGAAMSTDTAFALGALALLTPRAATRLRVFLLTLAVVDDLGALVVIATAYTKHVSMTALLVAIGLFAALRARVAQAAGGADRHRAVGGDVQVGHRPRDRRSRRGPRHECLSPIARRPRARDRADALLPRAADARTGPLRAARGTLGDLTQ